MFFNCVLNTGLIPKSWLEGVIFPIYKNKGDPKDPSNYRPITILSCMGKFFTSVLNQRLTIFLEENDIIEQNQAGFRKGYSCADHLFTLHSLFELLKKRKMKLFTAFIDFSQAFDSVWRSGLWHKMMTYNINGKFFTVTFNMYKNMKSRIKHNGFLSSTFMSEIGVRQGENLSPLLFSLFLNDLQTNMVAKGATGIELIDQSDLTIWLKLLILLYADDTVILSTDQTDFQKSLNIFNDYCKNWHLKINIQKTKVLVFGARTHGNYNFKIGNQPLEITDKYHYLGLTFSCNGSLLNARKHTVEQANKAMHFLFVKINNADLPLDLALKLFDHTVLPILTYGSEIFGYENLEIIERVHNNFLRKITNSRKSTPMSFLYGELGRYPISVIIESRMIAFWNRLVSGKEDKISLKVYKYMMNQRDSNFKWSNKIKEILCKVGRADLWQNQFQINHNQIHKIIKQTLIDQFQQQWHAQLQSSDKNKKYSNFKEKHEFEYYLKSLNKDEYLPLLKFRTANHHLPIEIGIYDGAPLNDRTCNLCNLEKIGSEKHYVLECPYFQNARQLYLANTDKDFKLLMSTHSEIKLKSLSKLVSVIMKSFNR